MFLSAPQGGSATQRSGQEAGPPGLQTSACTWDAGAGRRADRGAGRAEAVSKMSDAGRSNLLLHRLAACYGRLSAP